MKLIIAMCILFMSASVSLAGECVPYPEAEALLKNKYKEVPRFLGISQNGYLVQLYVSEKGTFSVLLITPQGLACMVDAGESGEFIPGGTPS